MVATLTFCYVFGDVIQSWLSWLLGLLFGFSFNETTMDFKYRRQVNQAGFRFRVINISILIVLLLMYIFSDVIASWRSWTSGFAYALGISGFLWTFDFWSKRDKKRAVR